MKKTNKYIALKKHDFLDNITDEGLISQAIIYYGDAINMIREATTTGDLSRQAAVAIVTDLILTVSRLDINYKRKSRKWWDGSINKDTANLATNQLTFIEGIHYISNPESTKLEIEIGIQKLQEMVEVLAYSFSLNLSKLIEDLVNTHMVAGDLILTEFAPKGMFIMDLAQNKKGEYNGIKIEGTRFNTGVINMDFFKASMHAINTDKDFGVKISENLKDHIDSLNDFLMIKFFNNGDPNDNAFYTLKTEGTINRLFRGEEDVTEKIMIEREGVALIPFTEYSMVLATPDMESLDDLLDYYNKHKV